MPKTVMIVEDNDFDVNTGAATLESNHNYGFDLGGQVGYDFGGFRLEAEVAYKEASVDFIEVAVDTGTVGGVGIDLVAMCVNDLICQGAEPLFFLDYFATGKLDVDHAAAVVEGIAEGCHRAGAALIGGETAEMPGMYSAGDFDLAGFAVGAMERGRMLPNDVSEGDVLVGVESTGVHSNGYSLVRRIVEQSGLSWNDPCPWGDGTLGEALLTPTEIYVKGAKAALDKGGLHALAHITGGGLTENLPRVLPEGLGAEIDLSAWSLPQVFRWLAGQGGLERSEMLKTFNCGIGMIAVVSGDDVQNARAAFEEAGHATHLLGHVIPGEGVTYTGTLD